MARAPRASVPASTGQGITRKAYQSAYKAKGGAGLTKMAQVKLKAPSSDRDYGKGSSGASTPQTAAEDLYGDVYTGLDDVLEIAARGEPQRFKDTRVQGKKLK